MKWIEYHVKECVVNDDGSVEDVVTSCSMNYTDNNYEVCKKLSCDGFVKVYEDDFEIPVTTEDIINAMLGGNNHG